MPPSTGPPRDESATPVRVLDLTGLTAAYATRLMAEAGATVVRVEAPAAREWSATQRALHAYFDAGKLGVTLDPRRPGGREVLARLLASCDVLVESQPPAYWTALGLDPDALLGDHPHLVVTSIDDTMPDLDVASAELRLCADSGLLSITGEPDGPPQLVGGHAALAMVGVQAAIGTYAALIWQRTGGRGQRVRIRMVDALQRLMEQPLLRWGIRGEPTPRAGARGGATAVNGGFRCRDGHVALSVSADAESWRRFLSLIPPEELPAALADPALEAEHARWPRRREIIALIEQWARQYTRAELVELFLARGLPAAPVLTVADLCQDPQLAARGFLAAPSPAGDVTPGAVVPVGAVAVAFGRTGAPRPAPAAGQDNAAVYATLGYDAPALAALAAAGTI